MRSLAGLVPWSLPMSLLVVARSLERLVHDSLSTFSILPTRVHGMFCPSQARGSRRGEDGQGLSGTTDSAVITRVEPLCRGLASKRPPHFVLTSDDGGDPSAQGVILPTRGARSGTPLLLQSPRAGRQPEICCSCNSCGLPAGQARRRTDTRALLPVCVEEVY